MIRDGRGGVAEFEAIVIYAGAEVPISFDVKAMGIFASRAQGVLFSEIRPAFRELAFKNISAFQD